MVFSAILSALLQVSILTLIPFIVYSITHKRITGFLKWIGLIKPSHKSIHYATAIAILSLALMSIPHYWMFQQGYLDNNLNEGFVTQSLNQTGWSGQTILVMLIWACVQTSLSEEIFFRGFLTKRLIKKFGFNIGNLIQASIFGAIHIVGVFSSGFLPSAIVFISTGAIAFSLGYLMDKKAEGSIIPGWSAHALVNVLSTILVSLY